MGPMFHLTLTNPSGTHSQSVVLREQLMVSRSGWQITACGEDESGCGLEIDQHHPDLEAFGRIDMHPMENLLAVSWIGPVPQACR